MSSGLTPGQEHVKASVAQEVTSTGARTPEELETLFEDALLLRDHAALAALFEEDALLAAGGARPARGAKEVTRLALATWEGDHIYIADPRRVVQAHDIALIVAERTVNVVRRGRDGVWRYAIVLLSNGNRSEGRAK